MRRHSRSRSRPRHLLPRPPQQLENLQPTRPLLPRPPQQLENLQPSCPIFCREAYCARKGELIAEDPEFVFVGGLWQLRFFCGRCGSCIVVCLSFHIWV